MDKYELSQHPAVIALANKQTETGLNDTDFCRRVKFDLSSSSWGKIKAGTYAGNCSGALKSVKSAMGAAMADRPETPIVEDGIVILDHIRDASDAVAAARIAQDEHRLVFVVSPAGGGKSKTGEYIAAKFAGTVINATPSWARSYMHTLTELAAGLGVSGKWNSAGAAERSILQTLALSPRLIIIDEANHFSRDSLNFLKTVINTTRCCLVLLTIPDHLAKMAADCREEFPQLLRRSIAIIHIPPIGVDDLTAIQHGLYPDLTVDTPIKICNLANQNSCHRYDTVFRVFDEMNAGKDIDAAIKSARNQVTAVVRNPLTK